MRVFHFRIWFCLFVSRSRREYQKSNMFYCNGITRFFAVALLLAICPLFYAKTALDGIERGRKWNLFNLGRRPKNLTFLSFSRSRLHTQQAGRALCVMRHVYFWSLQSNKSSNGPMEENITICTACTDTYVCYRHNKPLDRKSAVNQIILNKAKLFFLLLLLERNGSPIDEPKTRAPPVLNNEHSSNWSGKS